MYSHRAAVGFTLVEVLVATVILAIGLLGALTAFSMASRVSGVSNADTTLSFLAQSKLAEIQLHGREGIETLELEGDFAPEHPEYRWQTVVGEPDEHNIVRVDLYISYPASGTTHETAFSTSVF